MHLNIPVIADTKNYWLVRTQGGRYYNDFKKGGFIAINWDKISLEEINELSPKDLIERVRKDYPDKQKPGRTANQLRIFTKNIKRGDTVIITSSASSRLSIGEIIEDEPYIDYVKEEITEENKMICPFQKRKKVRWLKELHKWELEMELFKLLQHAQHTISEANDYADLIEGLIHNYFVRGNSAYLVLQVKKNGKIPMSEFFPLGSEILELAKQFNQFSKTINLELDDIDTKINVNSPGKIKLAGSFVTITVIGLLLVALTGGNFKVNFPEFAGGGSIELNMSSIGKEVSAFFDHIQAREQKEMILKKYMDHLEVKTPEELAVLMKSLELGDVPTKIENNDKAEDPSENK